MQMGHKNGNENKYLEVSQELSCHALLDLIFKRGNVGYLLKYLKIINAGLICWKQVS